MSASTESDTRAAVAVLKRFLDASLRKDEAEMKACLTRRTLESGQLKAGPEGVTFEVGEPAVEAEIIVVPVKGVPIENVEGAPPEMVLPCVMMREDGDWKLDMIATMERMMGGGMAAAFEQIGSAMGEAMKGVGDAMASAFGTSSADAPPNWDEAPGDYAPEELYALPERVPLPKTQAAVSAAVGSPVPVEVAIDDIMKKMGSDERDGMLTWMDDSLFAGYGGIFGAIHSYLPLNGRLRGVRIEAAEWHDDRMVALDGSDVVFRLHFPENSGFYSDGWVTWALPGVLSGLPATIDAAAAGHRLLPRKDETVTLELYRKRTLPRTMRKISALIGRPVRFEMDWDGIYDGEFTARALSWFGVNRVLGGIARSSLAPERLEAHRRELKTIRIVLAGGRDERAAKYEGGVLELSIDVSSWEHGGFYESDIAAVLDGQTITGTIAVDGSTSVVQ